MMRVRCVRGFVGAAPSSGEELTALMRVFNKYKEEGTKGATHALRMLQKPVTSEKRELRAFSVLLSFQAQAGRWKTARQILKDMGESGFPPGTKAFNSVITACGQARQLEAAREVYQEMVNQGIERNVEIYCALLVGLVQTGNWERAMELLDEVENPSILFYTLAIQSCCKSNSGAAALTILNRAKEEGLKLNTEIYRSTMAVLGRAGMCTEAFSLWEEWKGSDLEIHLSDYNAAIEAQCLNWLSAKAIFDQITADGLQADEDSISHITLSAMASAPPGEGGRLLRHAKSKPSLLLAELVAMHQSTFRPEHPPQQSQQWETRLIS